MSLCSVEALEEQAAERAQDQPEHEAGDGGKHDEAAFQRQRRQRMFTRVGGSMVKVQQNMAKLSAEDRNAIAAYLKAIPAR